MLKNSFLAFIKGLNIKIDPVKLTWMLAFSLLLTAVAIFFQWGKMANGKLQIFVCDVGQGDAIYIKSPKGLDILIDGGPDNEVLSCLGKHMPFWDHKIEMVFLTHPHSDHMTGIITVLGRYTVDRFFASANSPLLPKNPQLLVAGDKIKTDDGVAINVIWPPKDFSVTDLNQISLILQINNALFMGDAEATALSWINFPKIDFLKVPHHGARTALTSEFLTQTQPKIAAISVGKNNTFGHPAKETLELLKNFNIQIKRTDLDGEIAIPTKFKQM